MDGSVADTDLGRLRGHREDGVVVFRGVPFAAPPVGPLRFQPAAPATPWEGERDAGRHGPAAPQNRSDLAHFMGDLTLETAEDCLTLTVWTPACDDARRPVLLWLHGGAFISGAGSVPWYEGARLAAEGDMVVVTANYRLGALGWLCWPGVAPGNMGLSDQAAALRWVHANAAAFGGDPDRLTMGGQSAGATTTARLMLDPALAPLVRRVLLQSGGLGREPTSPADTAATGAAFLAALGIDPAAEGLRDRLQAVPVDAILRAQPVAERVGFGLPVRCQAWRPLVDAPLTQAALLDHTADALAGKDVMVGITGAEGHAFIGGPLPQETTMEAVAPRLAALAGTDADLPHYVAFCPGATPAEWLATIMSDYLYVFASLGLAGRVAARNGNVHVYLFDWAPPGRRFGAGHCIDLPFCFGTLPAWQDAPMLAGGDPAIMDAVSGLMRQALIGFVRDGVPWIAEPLTWPGYGDDRTVLHVGHRTRTAPAAAGLLDRAPIGSTVW